MKSTKKKIVIMVTEDENGLDFDTSISGFTKIEAMGLVFLVLGDMRNDIVSIPTINTNNSKTS